MHRAKRIQLHKALALLLSLSLLLTAALGGTFAYIITQTPSLFNTFLSGLDPTGDLLIRKEVTHPFGSSYTIPDGIRFDFAVSLGEDYGGKTVETSQGEMTADGSGNLTVSIAPDEAVRIKDLMDGTSVTVTETAANGFTPNGDGEKSITIQSGENNITYTNAYAPGPVSPVNLTVSGTKLLEGRDWQEGDSFTFQLEYKLAGNDNWQNAGTASVSYDPANADFNKFSFTELVQGITYASAGTYSFRMSEIDGTIGGITYDKVVSYFDVLVGDADMNGSLEIQDVQGFQNAAASYDASTGNYHVDVTVNNKYAPAGTAGVTIHINKAVQSRSGEDKSCAGYTFELYDESGALVAISGETSAAGEISIELTYDAKDAGTTFHYTLKETHSGETHNGLTYDSTVYSISVSVVDDLDGTISAYVYNTADYKTELLTIEPEETEPTEGTDTPIEDTDEPTEGTDTPTEDTDEPTEENGTPAEDTTEPTEEDDTPAEDTTEPTEEDDTPAEDTTEPTEEDDTPAEDTTVPTEENDTPAENTEEPAENTETPVENTQPAEESVSDPAETAAAPAEDEVLPVPVDGAADAVKDAGDETTIPADSGSETEEAQAAPSAPSPSAPPADVNGAEPSAPPAATDTPTGDSDDSTESTDAPAEAPVDPPTSDSGTIVETDTPAEPGTTSETKEVVIIPEGASDTYSVSFENVYDPSDTQASLDGTKELNGRDLKEGEFSFDLYATGDGFTVTEGMEPVQSVTNGADGSFAFAAIGYDKVGTYRYVVKEDSSANLGGVTYDDSVFHVIVTVSDEDGALSASTAITDELGTAAEIQFQNRYKAAATSVTIKGSKTLSGMELASDMFQFLLYPADESYTIQGDPLAGASNDASGGFAFEGILCSQPGTFYYVVKEDTSPQTAGMTYDDTVYGIKVSVWDDGTGSLKASVTITEAGGEVDAILFENSYTEPEPSPSPTPSAPGGTDVPPTGDDAPIGLYLTIFLTSLTAVILLVSTGKRRKEKG